MRNKAHFVFSRRQRPHLEWISQLETGVIFFYSFTDLLGKRSKLLFHITTYICLKVILVGKQSFAGSLVLYTA